MAAHLVTCPYCGSESITAQKQGFDPAKATGGLLLVGPLGLFGGLFGSQKIQITCLNCGRAFAPGTKPADLQAEAVRQRISSIGCLAIVVIVAFVIPLLSAIKSFVNGVRTEAPKAQAAQPVNDNWDEGDHKHIPNDGNVRLKEEVEQEPKAQPQQIPVKTSEPLPASEPEVQQITPLRPSRKLLADMTIEKAKVEKEPNREKVATGKLEMAKIVIKKNEPAGIKRLKEIIDDYAGTPAAEEAANILKFHTK